MHDQFRRRVERLTDLVKSDPVGNRDEILDEMKGFSKQHEALRYFLTKAIGQARYRRLGDYALSDTFRKSGANGQSTLNFA